MDELVHGVAGSISGLISATVWYPLETIRIRLQQKYLEEHNKENTKSINSNDGKKLNEVKDEKDDIENRLENREKQEKDKLEESLLYQTWILFKKIIKEEGVKGLYSGISSCLFGSVVSYGIYFFTYEYWKNYFIKHNLGKNVLFDSMCTSFLGALCTAVITNPVWVLNARMSQSKSKVILFLIVNLFRLEIFQT